jgi:NAD(P)-dependent dehydrogenase (short-subunit alcohol dehydrogenase family)
MRDLEDKVAVVTGGARGIGLACAQALSAAGARVVLADIDLDEAEKRAVELQDGSIAVRHDVRDAGSARNLVATTLRECGRVDVLVNNAGMNIGARATVDITDDEFDRVLSINCRGVFLTTRAFLPPLIEQRSGRIINMSSIVGQRGIAKVLPYTAAKFAVTGMTQALAAELAPYDITVNSVHPGMVATDLHSIVVSGFSSLQGQTVEEADAAFQAMIPLGRYQSAGDVGEMVAFLASDKGRNITGSAFNVDGGLLLA